MAIGLQFSDRRLVQLKNDLFWAPDDINTTFGYVRDRSESHRCREQMILVDTWHTSARAFIDRVFNGRSC